MCCQWEEPFGKRKYLKTGKRDCNILSVKYQIQREGHSRVYDKHMHRHDAGQWLPVTAVEEGQVGLKKEVINDRQQAKEVC